MQIPTQTTLKKYGLTEALWINLYNGQERKCACCKAPFEDENGEKLRNSYIDHEHVKGFKQMIPEQKRRFIRGICCYTCNKLTLPKSSTIERLEAAIRYLRNYKEKKIIRELLEQDLE